MRLPLLLLSLLPLALSQRALDDTADPLLQRANALLSSGAFLDAARAYSDLLSSPPPETPPYLLYYKRATAYFSLSRHQAAIEDYDKVLELNKGMTRAWVMKARCLAREGQWGEAKAALKEYTARERGEKDPAAAEVLLDLADAEAAEKKARAARKAGGWAACQASCGDALRVGTHAWGVRELRAECALAEGQIEEAIADYTRMSHLRPSDTALLLRLSTLSFYLLSNPTTPALTHLKACLHSDPEHAGCLRAHRTLKSLTRTLEAFRTARDENKWASVKKSLDGEDGLLARWDKEMSAALKSLAPPLPASITPQSASQPRMELLSALCTSHTRLSTARAGEAHCRALLALDPNSGAALAGLGQLAMEQEDWEEAVRLLERAWEADGRPRGGDAAERLQKAQRLLKQSKSKDYYKVLGVPRDADAREIKKAYRKAAMKAHPDKGGSEKQMAAVNEAYEVLSNEDLRRRFDAGDDPNEPQTGHPFFQGANPFQHFFQQGAGGGGGSPFGAGGGFPGGAQFQFQWGRA